MKKILAKLTLIAFFAGIFSIGLYVAGSESQITAGPTDGVTGCWRTIDDKTGKIKSKVCIWTYKGVLYGKIKQLYPADPDKKCTACGGNYKNKPIEGMMIMWGLKKGSDAWEGGKILDPASGKVYGCKLWVEGGKLKVRGYLGISALGRSQTWVR